MQFLVRRTNKPNMESVRLRVFDAHEDYFKANIGHILVAGLTFADDAATVTGNALILDFPDRAALDRFLAEDPNTEAGLFTNVDVTVYRKTLP